MKFPQQSVVLLRLGAAGWQLGSGMRREVIAFLGALASRWITHLSTRCVFVHTALVFPHQNTERCLLFVLLTLMCFKNTKMDHSVLQGPLFARFLSLFLCFPFFISMKNLRRAMF